MRVKFATWGNSLAFRVPAPVAKELGATKDTIANITLYEGKMIVEVVDDFPVYDLNDLVEGITDENRHGEIHTGHAVGNEFG